ncbi:tellurite resistance TerB family protein [Rhodobacter sp. NSM]|uniref:tellurite resistance TerB family protein n=1 Tax=Rhodobacter sp. NSM TaxID=3457501 RepID=UPI003FD29D07
MKDAGFLQNGTRGVPVARGHLSDGSEAVPDGCGGRGRLADLVAGFLLGDRARCCLEGAAARNGIVALSCVVAGRAWADWTEGRDTCGPLGAEAGPEAAEEDAGSAEGLCERLLQAMVAAAKADGRVCRNERRFIHRRLRELDLDCDAQALIAAELEAPLDAGRIARLARTPQEAAGIYAASLLAAGSGGPAEIGYFTDLAGLLRLEPELVVHLHRRVASVGTYALLDAHTRSASPNP